MKVKIMFALFFFCLQMAFAQHDIFEIARKGTVAELQEILSECPDKINAVNEAGYDLITLATYKGNNEVAAFLIKKGANINGKSQYGSPLMAAVVKGNTEIAKMLINAGADLNISDNSGNTALIYAVIFKKYEIAEMLVKASAIIDFRDIRGNSAVDYAKMTNDEKLLQLFKKERL